jgi:hypothetical protein
MKSIVPPRLEAAIRSRLGVSAPPSEDTPLRGGERDPSDVQRATSRPRRQHKNHPGTQGVLSDAEIVRTLMRYRYDRTFRGERRVPIKTLATYLGLSHETLYEAMRSRTMSDRTRTVLSGAITAIAKGQLRFRRRRQRWTMEASEPLPPIAVDQFKRTEFSIS